MNIIPLIIVGICLLFIDIAIIICIKINVDYKKSIEQIYKNALWDSFIANSNKMKFIKKFVSSKGIIYYDFNYSDRYKVTVADELDKKPYSYIGLMDDSHNIVISSYNRKKSEELAQILLAKISE